MTKAEAADILCNMIYNPEKSGDKMILAEALNMAIKSLREDTVPIKHGHWIHREETNRFYEHWDCSICGHDILENPSFKNPITGEQLDFLFCPYCMAKMDGKDEFDGRRTD